MLIFGLVFLILLWLWIRKIRMKRRAVEGIEGIAEWARPRSQRDPDLGWLKHKHHTKHGF